MESRATQSVRVPVRNLRAVDPSIDPEALQESLGWQFLRTSVDGCDGGMDAARKQRGFQMVRPDEGWFPGIDELREELASHQWIFGKTPRFKVTIFKATCSMCTHSYVVYGFVLFFLGPSDL